jgi:hypothetical protein
MLTFILFVVKSILGILWFLLTLGVLVTVWKDDRRETLNKLLWTGGILFFPVLGPIVYMVSQKQ